MRRVVVFLVTLVLATSVVFAQGKTEKAPKTKASVDCSGADDSRITADVKAKLAAAASLKELAINVTTSGGVVTLNGAAMKPTQKGTASRVAKSVPCVKKVDNQMTVEGAKKAKS
jgi:hyperosmotically inducible periplasmic protein